MMEATERCDVHTVAAAAAAAAAVPKCATIDGQLISH
jgi:hypothetical protein